MKKYSTLCVLTSMLIALLLTDGGARLTLLSCDETNNETKDINSEKSNSNTVIPVTVTAYSPTVEECDDDPYTTAFQKPVREGTIAISRDLENEFGWRVGDRVHIAGLGEFVVWDRMHPRWKKRVDVFFYDTEKAVSFGIKQSKVIRMEKPALRET